MELIRIWKEIDIADIDAHLIIVDDMYGYCPKCKAIGIKYEAIKNCPQCGIEFKYIATRENLQTHSGRNILGKIKKFASDLVLIDYNDYKYATDKKKASDLFKI
ncbi:MAG: hypothetical protein JW982_13600 [Spirochaetes bacterium]|nr:hypothetical protein [Spirochaetota bacterium]